ncbi:MAG: hypothetical protein JWL95_3264 [Gemmatimonadetes bacterium]|nr:hypothetical protein [Gemmatimonadota bacterium]
MSSANDWSPRGGLILATFHAGEASSSAWLNGRRCLDEVLALALMLTPGTAIYLHDSTMTNNRWSARTAEKKPRRRRYARETK